MLTLYHNDMSVCAAKVRNRIGRKETRLEWRPPRLPVHNIALTVNGVHLLENLVLEALAKARAYEFAFIMQPLKLQGATGSTVAPTAIR